MPVDEQLQRVIDLARATKWLRSDQLPFAMARALYRERYLSRTLPADPTVVIDAMSIPGDDGDIDARLYRPVRASGRAPPLIIYFHGGGFVLGDADAYEPQSTLLASRSQCLVLFVEYRLAPE